MQAVLQKILVQTLAVPSMAQVIRGITTEPPELQTQTNGTDYYGVGNGYYDYGNGYNYNTYGTGYNGGLTGTLYGDDSGYSTYMNNSYRQGVIQNNLGTTNGRTYSTLYGD